MGHIAHMGHAIRSIGFFFWEGKNSRKKVMESSFLTFLALKKSARLYNELGDSLSDYIKNKISKLSHCILPFNMEK